jgi:hypothetical protein
VTNKLYLLSKDGAMSKVLGTVLLFSALVGYTACVQEVIIDLPESPPMLVAVSHFKPGEPFYVRVTRTQSIYADQTAAEVPDPLDVSVSTGGQFLDKLRKVVIQGKTYWESRDLVQPGVTYKLTVRKPGMGLLTAEGHAPHHVPLKPVVVSGTNIEEFTLVDGTHARRIPLELRLAQLPDKNRYFGFAIRHQTYATPDGSGPQLGGELQMENTFFSTDGRTSALLYPIAEPIILVDESFWNGPDPVIRLDLIIPIRSEMEAPRLVTVEWRTLSEDFYRYHLSLTRQINTPPLSAPDAIYNNVRNGFGTFSGYAAKIDTVLEIR